MCVAIEKMRMDSRLESEIKGAVKACKNFNLSVQKTVQYLIDNLNLSVQEAEEGVRKSWI